MPITATPSMVSTLEMLQRGGQYANQLMTFTAIPVAEANAMQAAMRASRTTVTMGWITIVLRPLSLSYEPDKKNCFCFRRPS